MVDYELAMTNLKSTMGTKGAGAQIAWSIQSRKTLSDLTSIVGAPSITRWEFEDGERFREKITSKYEAHRDSDEVQIHQYKDSDALKLALCDFLEKEISEGEVVLFLQDAERRGVYSIEKRALQMHSTDILAYDGSCVYCASPSGRVGFVLDYQPDDAPDLPYELETWQR